MTLWSWFPSPRIIQESSHHWPSEADAAKRYPECTEDLALWDWGVNWQLVSHYGQSFSSSLSISAQLIQFSGKALACHVWTLVSIPRAASFLHPWTFPDFCSVHSQFSVLPDQKCSYACDDPCAEHLQTLLLLLPVLVRLMSTWHKLELSEMTELQMRKCFHFLNLWLMWGSPSLLWALPSLGCWSWVLKDSRLSKPRGTSQLAALLVPLGPCPVRVPILTSFNDE